MKLLKEIFDFVLGFLPWMLFLFISGHTLASLEKSLLICLAASLAFGFKGLRKGFIINWGTLLFFTSAIVLVNFMKVMFIIENMGIIVNGFLMLLFWITILIGKPFTLQLAREELPKEVWHHPDVLRSCLIIAVVWAILLSLSTAVGLFEVFNPGLYPDYLYFDISLLIMFSGLVFTLTYKRYKRSQRQSQA